MATPDFARVERGKRNAGAVGIVTHADVDRCNQWSATVTSNQSHHNGYSGHVDGPNSQREITATD